jgi:hypothetical protein
MLPSTFRKMLTDLTDEKYARMFLKSIWFEGIRFEEAKDLSNIDTLNSDEVISLSHQALPIYVLQNFSYDRWLH